MCPQVDGAKERERVHPEQRERLLRLLALPGEPCCEFALVARRLVALAGWRGVRKERGGGVADSAGVRSGPEAAVAVPARAALNGRGGFAVGVRGPRRGAGAGQRPLKRRARVGCLVCWCWRLNGVAIGEERVDLGARSGPRRWPGTGTCGLGLERGQLRPARARLPPRRQPDVRGVGLVKRAAIGGPPPRRPQALAPARFAVREQLKTRSSSQQPHRAGAHVRVVEACSARQVDALRAEAIGAQRRVRRACSCDEKPDGESTVSHGPSGVQPPQTNRLTRHVPRSGRALRRFAAAQGGSPRRGSTLGHGP